MKTQPYTEGVVFRRWSGVVQLYFQQFFGNNIVIITYLNRINA